MIIRYFTKHFKARQQRLAEQSRQYEERKEKERAEYEARMHDPQTYADMQKAAYGGYLDYLGGTR